MYQDNSSYPNSGYKDANSSLNAFTHDAFHKDVPQVQDIEAHNQAGFWLRFIAYSLDSFVVGFLSVPLFIVTSLAESSLGSNPSPESQMALSSLYIPLFTLIGMVYSAFMVSSEHQATLGKKALGLIVVTTHGEKLSFWHAAGRYFTKLVGGYIPFAYVICGFTPHKQALHDFIVQTYVIRKK